jgi:hypothetical protein
MKTIPEIKRFRGKMISYLAKSKDRHAETPYFQDFSLGRRPMIFFREKQPAVNFFKFFVG